MTVADIAFGFLCFETFLGVFCVLGSCFIWLKRANYKNNLTGQLLAVQHIGLIILPVFLLVYVCGIRGLVTDPTTKVAINVVSSIAGGASSTAYGALAIIRLKAMKSVLSNAELLVGVLSTIFAILQICVPVSELTLDVAPADFSLMPLASLMYLVSLVLRSLFLLFLEVTVTVTLFRYILSIKKLQQNISSLPSRSSRGNMRGETEVETNDVRGGGGGEGRGGGNGLIARFKTARTKFYNVRTANREIFREFITVVVIVVISITCVILYMLMDFAGVMEARTIFSSFASCISAPYSVGVLLLTKDIQKFRTHTESSRKAASQKSLEANLSTDG